MIGYRYKAKAKGFWLQQKKLWKHINIFGINIKHLFIKLIIRFIMDYLIIITNVLVIIIKIKEKDSD
jgi:hypothetical protein